MEQRVQDRLRKDFRVGSEDWNDVLFSGQRIRWVKDPQSGPRIEVSQEEAIEKIPVERNTKDLHCTPCSAYKVKTPSRTENLFAEQDTDSVGTSFPDMHQKAASPTIGHVKALKHGGKTTQDSTSKISFLATHRTFEKNWIS